jgi:exosome complex exonuclease RRP6
MHLRVRCRYVLTNRSLFQLAERSPTDMASLLATFKSIPPVVRRRAKELLDTIQDAMKRHRETPFATEEDQSDVAIKSIVVPIVGVEAVGAVETTAPDALSSRLWSQGSYNLIGSIETLNGRDLLPLEATSSGKTSASSSTLFGSTLSFASDVKIQTPKAYSTSTSALFSNKSLACP